MRLRFIEYHDEIYAVVGITYTSYYTQTEAFVAVPISLKKNTTITRDLIQNHSVIIPIEMAMEIVDETKIKTLMLLYDS